MNDLTDARAPHTFAEVATPIYDEMINEYGTPGLDTLECAIPLLPVITGEIADDDSDDSE